MHQNVLTIEHKKTLPQAENKSQYFTLAELYYLLTETDSFKHY